MYPELFIWEIVNYHHFYWWNVNFSLLIVLFILRIFSFDLIIILDLVLVDRFSSKYLTKKFELGMRTNTDKTVIE